MTTAELIAALAPDVYVLSEGGHKQFRIITTSCSGHSVEFEVREIISWEPDTDEPIDEELYLTAYMKFDNCNHFYFGELEGDSKKQNGYLHLCGDRCMRAHIRLMAYLYEYAFKVMGRTNDEPLEISKALVVSVSQ